MDCFGGQSSLYKNLTKNEKDEDSSDEEDYYSDEMISLEETELIGPEEEEEDRRKKKVTRHRPTMRESEGIDEEEDFDLLAEEDENDEVTDKKIRKLQKSLARMYDFSKTEDVVEKKEEMESDEKSGSDVIRSSTESKMETYTSLQTYGSCASSRTQETLETLHSVGSLVSEEGIEYQFPKEETEKKILEEISHPTFNFTTEDPKYIPVRDKQEERDMVIMAIRNSIVEEVTDRAFKRFRRTLPVPFTVLCMQKSWRKLLYMFDLEKPENIDVTTEQWQEDEEPEKCEIDPWATNEIPVDYESYESDNMSDTSKDKDIFNILPHITDELGLPIKSYDFESKFLKESESGESSEKEKAPPIDEEYINSLIQKYAKKYNEQTSFGTSAEEISPLERRLKSSKKDALKTSNVISNSKIPSPSRTPSKGLSFLRRHTEHSPPQTSLPPNRIQVGYELLPPERDLSKRRAVKKTTINVRSSKEGHNEGAEKTFTRVMNKIKKVSSGHRK